MYQKYWQGQRKKYQIEPEEEQDVIKKHDDFDYPSISLVNDLLSCKGLPI